LLLPPFPKATAGLSAGAATAAAAAVEEEAAVLWAIWTEPLGEREERRGKGEI